MPLSRLLATQSTLAKDNQNRQPGYIYEGIVVTGSWDPGVGTIKVTEGQGYNQFPDSGSEFVSVTATLMYPSPGMCAPPVGGEQVCFCETQGGWIAWYDNCFQSVINTPAGEFWIQHRDENGNVDSYIKLTNDGTTSGDNKGSLTTLVGALLHIATAGGLKIVARDDSNLVGIGDDPANMGTQQLAIRVKDLTSILDNFATNIKTWAATNFQTGTSTPPTGPTVPAITGSNSVEIKD